MKFTYKSIKEHEQDFVNLTAMSKRIRYRLSDVSWRLKSIESLKENETIEASIIIAKHELDIKPIENEISKLRVELDKIIHKIQQSTK